MKLYSAFKLKMQNLWTYAKKLEHRVEAIRIVQL